MTRCTYCAGPARLLTGSDIYPHRPDLAHVKVWRCDPCNAQVGCHDGTKKPKGTFAKPALMRMRQLVHRQFDPLWQRWCDAYTETTGAPAGVLRRIARGRAYAWLADQMGMDEVHIGEFDEAHCEWALNILGKREPTPASIRAWAKARREAA